MSQPPRGAPGEIHAGLMSGTSMDGVDAALIDFDAEGRLRGTLATASLPMPDALRNRLAGLQHPGHDELARAAQAANDLADLYAECVKALLREAGLDAGSIRAIGAHGQTVRHAPAEGYSLQILNGARLAVRTAIPVVADLRSADIAIGGQGAPLMPAFHAHVFRELPGRCGILNLGGIANLSIIEPAPQPPDEGKAQDTPTADAHAVAGGHAPPAKVTGFDTGPANALIDGWIERHRQLRYDHDGAWAASGQPIGALLTRMLADPFFAQAAPKSTGRERFNLGWVDAHLAALGLSVSASQAGNASHACAPEDVQATLLALTVESTAAAIRAHRLDAVYVCGGGARNAHLMARLQAAAGPGTPIRSTEALGIAPQAVEATGFAWLSWQRLHASPTRLGAITGARQNAILGALHLPPPGQGKR